MGDLQEPLIVFDKIFWQPRWAKTPDNELKEQVGTLMARDIDGDYI